MTVLLWHPTISSRESSQNIIYKPQMTSSSGDPLLKQSRDRYYSSFGQLAPSIVPNLQYVVAYLLWINLTNCWFSDYYSDCPLLDRFTIFTIQYSTLTWLASRLCKTERGQRRQQEQKIKLPATTAVSRDQRYNRIQTNGWRIMGWVGGEGGFGLVVARLVFHVSFLPRSEKWETLNWQKTTSSIFSPQFYAEHEIST